MKSSSSRAAITAAVLAMMLSAAAPTVLGAAADACDGRETSATAIELCGTTTITGPGGAVVTVHVPTDVAIDSRECLRPGGWSEPCALDIEGFNGLDGIVFSEVRDDPSEGRILWLGRIHDGSDFTYQGWARGLGSQAHDGVTLPAGTYRLHLATSRPTATVTLSVPSLDGSIVAAPTVVEHHELVEVPSVLTADGTQEAAYVGGRTVEVPVEALTLVTMKVDGVFAGANGVCVYHGEPAGPPEVAYAPLCPQRQLGLGGPNAFSDAAAYNSFGGTRLTSVWERAPGRYGMGIWQAFAGTPSNVTVLTLAVAL